MDTLLQDMAEAPVQLSRRDLAPVSYHSLPSHGVSLQYEGGECRAVDVYNEGAVKGWSCFSRLPLNASLRSCEGAMLSLHLDTSTTGAQLVSQLGEPYRKGGGEPMKGGGASGLGPGAWMEWNMEHEGRPIQVMVEMAGQAARGLDRWEKERAGAALWGVCTFALP